MFSFFCTDISISVKIYILFFGLLVYTNLSCYGQSFLGFGGGISINRLSESSKNIDVNYKPGRLMNLTFSHQLNKKLALVFEPFLIQKNYEKEGIDKMSSREIITNEYLQFSGKFRFFGFQTGKNAFFIESGPYFGYWLSSKIKGEYPNLLSVQFNDTNHNYVTTQTIHTKNNFNKLKDNRWDYGLDVAIGDRFFIKRSEFEFKIIYSQSVQDQQKSYMLRQATKLNQSFNFVFIYGFSL